MSAFGYIPKDDVVDAIKELASAENERGANPREVVESIMEAVAYGINSALYELGDQKVNS
jgi:hypothetical protein